MYFLNKINMIMNIEEIKNRVANDAILQQKLKTDFRCKDTQTGKSSCCTSAIIPNDSVEYYATHFPVLEFHCIHPYDDKCVSVQLTQKTIQIIETLLECSILK
jgi:hypothetical protein